MKKIGSSGEHQLQKSFDSESKADNFYSNQMLGYLNTTMQDFILNQSMVFIATSDAQGECDCSFRAGSPGFVKILNKKKLAYPEYKGNGVWASLGNILENPHIGMIFIDFFKNTIGLHVNGKAKIIENKDILQDKELSESLIESPQNKDARKPERWVVVEVEEAYIHCSKHIPLLKKLDKKINWGTDNEALKGGDFFKVKNSNRR
jgi:predicted pyridoxine 5'-phosphate oxidase superfamily flavin-nucleotide-binding protein